MRLVIVSRLAAIAGCVSEAPLVPDAGPDATLMDATVDAPSDVVMDACGAKCSCGDAGRNCLGGDCVNGACQPVTVAMGQNHPLGLRVDTDGTLFWVNRGTTMEALGPGDRGVCVGSDGSVMRLGPSDMAPVAIATMQDCPIDLLLIGLSVYWLTPGTAANNYADGRVQSVAKTGASQVLRVSGLAYPTGFATDNSSLYITQAGPGATSVVGAGALLRFPAGGGSGVTMASNLTLIKQLPRGVAFAGSTVYWFSDATSLQTLRALPSGADGGVAPASVITGEDSAISLVVSPDGSALFWVQGRDASSKPARMLVLDSGTPSSVGASYYPLSITTDGKRAFWGHGGIAEADLAIPDSSVLLVSGAQSAHSMAVRGAAVYWANYATGEIKKLAW